MFYLQKIIKWSPAIIIFAAPLYLVQLKFGWFSTNALEILMAGFLLIWLFYSFALFFVTPAPRPSVSAQGGEGGKAGVQINLGLASRLEFTLTFPKGGNDRKEAWRSQFFLPIILILAGALSSSLAVADPKTSFGILKSWFVLPALFGWAMADLIKEKEDIKRILIAWISSGVAVSLISLIYFWQGKFTFDGRLAAFYLSPNHLAMYLAPAFLVSLVLGFFARKDAEKIFLYAAAILMAVVIYFTFSYGAWLGILAGILVVIIVLYFVTPAKAGVQARINLDSRLRGNDTKKFFIVFIVVILLIILLFLGNSQKFINLVNFDRSSLQSRLMIWRSAGLILKDHWFLGIGPGNFQGQYLAYQKYFPPYLEWAVPQPHNLFLAFWLQTGLVGLAGFIWLYILLLKINLSLWLKQKEPLALALLAVLIYILIHGLLDTPLWKNDLALIFAVIIFLTSQIGKFEQNS